MNYAQVLPLPRKIDRHHNPFPATPLKKNKHIIPEYTINSTISCTGIGLHSGKTVNLKLYPAPSGTGIVFYRTDFPNHPIRAYYGNVIDTTLSTVIATADHPEIRIGTIEHLMAALAGNQINNAIIECDGPEIPVMDGSSALFNQLLQKAGRQLLFSITPIIKILKPIRVESQDSFAELQPSSGNHFSLSLSIDFSGSMIGKQQFSMIFNPVNFQKELAHCRTFTHKEEIDTLHKMGLAQGGSLQNAIVVDRNAILNPEGLYCKDEFVKHKMLDAVGDIALLGCNLYAHFIGHKSGHALNNRLLHKLIQEKDSWQYYIPPYSSSFLPAHDMFA